MGPLRRVGAEILGPQRTSRRMGFYQTAENDHINQLFDILHVPKLIKTPCVAWSFYFFHIRSILCQVYHVEYE